MAGVAQNLFIDFRLKLATKLLSLLEMLTTLFMSTQKNVELFLSKQLAKIILKILNPLIFLYERVSPRENNASIYGLEKDLLLLMLRPKFRVREVCQNTQFEKEGGIAFTFDCVGKEYLLIMNSKRYDLSWRRQNETEWKSAEKHEWLAKEACQHIWAVSQWYRDQSKSMFNPYIEREAAVKSLVEDSFPYAHWKTHVELTQAIISS